MRIERVVFVVHPGKPEAAAMRDELTTWLRDRGIEVADGDPDLVVSLGGDGTMLRAAQVAHAADVPLIGINLGVIGYLTEVDRGQERVALEKLLSDSYEIEERMMIACEVLSDGATRSFVALNEALVERTAWHRLVRLEVRISGQRFAVFNGDGVIVATPTGSTAYALSAGGPIVSPRARALLVVPVNPHMILSRPVVLAPDEVVEIAVATPERAASLSLDGHSGCDLEPGERVVVRRHPRPLKLVRLSGPGFIERLRSKMSLLG